jgi:hypothetical protein
MRSRVGCAVYAETAVFMDSETTINQLRSEWVDPKLDLMRVNKVLRTLRSVLGDPHEPWQYLPE